MCVSLQDLDLVRWRYEELGFILQLFECEDCHFLVVHDEVRAELAHVRLDEHIARSRRTDDAVQSLACAPRFRVP